MDLGADVTNTFDRSKGVYPIFKSSTLGYAYGHKREDEFDGVCSQIAPDCGDMWSHIEKCNGYNCGKLNRRVDEEYTRDASLRYVIQEDMCIINDLLVQIYVINERIEKLSTRPMPTHGSNYYLFC